MSDENVIFTNNSDDFSSGEVEINVDDIKNDMPNLNDDMSEEDLSDDVNNDISDAIWDDKKEDEKEDNKDNFSNELQRDSLKKEEKESEEEVVVISKSKMILIEKLLENIKESNDKIRQLLGSSLSKEAETRIGIGQAGDNNLKIEDQDSDDSRIIEGVFDGENMIGPDGKQYSMPANYASKSKLVEGDIMKLTITDRGNFVYKQIGPIERRRVVGTIKQTENGNFVVVDENGKSWRVLTASVTYYKGQAGDEAVVLVPQNGDSQWAALDNVVRSKE